jgi:hypothetical protein
MANTDLDMLQKQPVAPPEPESREYTTAVPPTWREKVDADLQLGAEERVRRWVTAGQFSDATDWDKFLAARYTGSKGLDVTLFGDKPAERKPNLVDPVELNQRYAPKGEDWFDKPMDPDHAREVAKDIRGDLHARAVEARWALFHPGVSGTLSLGNLTSDIASEIMDPGKVALDMMPGPFEGRIAAALGGGVLARLAAHGVSGGIGAGLAAAPMTGVRLVEDHDYSLREAMGDLATSAAFGAVFQGLGVGGVKELWRWKFPAKAAHNAASTAASQIIDGKPVDVTAQVYPPATPEDIQVIRNHLATMKAGERPALTEDQINSAASIYHTTQDAGNAIRESLITKVPQNIGAVIEKEATQRRDGYAEGQSKTDIAATEEESARAESAKPAEFKMPPEIEEVLPAPQPLLAELTSRTGLRESLEHPQEHINRDYDVPYQAASNAVGGITYIDRHLNTMMPTPDGRLVDISGALHIHEQIERAGMEELMKRGLTPEQAYIASHHLLAEVAERDYVENTLGLNWSEYQKFIAKQEPKIQKEQLREPPPDAYTKPYPHDRMDLAKKEPTGGVAQPTPAEKAAVSDLRSQLEASLAAHPEVVAAKAELDSAKANIEGAYSQAAQCLMEAGFG